jgi:hypothetical protein
MKPKASTALGSAYAKYEKQLAMRMYGECNSGKKVLLGLLGLKRCL